MDANESVKQNRADQNKNRKCCYTSGEHFGFDCLQLLDGITNNLNSKTLLRYASFPYF